MSKWHIVGNHMPRLALFSNMSAASQLKISSNVGIENTRWVSFDIKFTRQGFENACWHREACRDIENTRLVSFDIKFTRQGLENACWHREVCRAIQHVFSKPSQVNLISKVANLVFYLSVYPLLNTLQTSDYDVTFDFCVDSEPLATSFKKCNVIMTW